jgi:hypothetical protein
MSYQVVLNLDDDDNDPRYRIRSRVKKNAQEDKTTVLIDREKAKRDGVALDEHGFPTSASLEAWHRKNNPHLFND